jgi:membrane protein DedA with SNARE-associated domain
VTHLIVTYGYFAVAFLVGIESFGIPLPGETILVAAALYAGHTHRLSVWVLFAVAAAAAIVGDNIGFALGHKGGYRLIRRYGHYIRLDEQKLEVGRDLFDRHGPKVVFFGRFVSILRTYAAFLAGANRMAWRKFLTYNAAGGIVWAATYTFASYNLGSAFSSAQTTITVALAAAAAVAITAAILLLRRQSEKTGLIAQGAAPGPVTSPLFAAAAAV